MPDYECHPLWGTSPDDVGDVAPGSLRLPGELVERLHAWSAAYDATLDRDDPAESGFGSRAERAAFDDEGAELVRLLDLALAGEVGIVSEYRRGAPGE
jgi:hypothetical protein